MKFDSFRIKSIKSIIDSGVCHLAGDNITILAGQNEAGKSAILEALNYFTNGINERFKKYSIREDEIPYVECCFKLENDDTEYEDENITKVLKKIPSVKCYREGEEEIAFHDETKSLIESIINELIKEQVLKNVTTSEQMDEKDNESEPDSMITVADLCDKIESTVLDYLPKFDYYDSFTNILPETIKIQDINGNDAVKDFQRTFDIDLETYIELPIRKKAKRKHAVEENLRIDFNDYWSQRLTGEDSSEYTFIIEDKQDEISFMVDRGNNEPLFIVQKSKGFQWFVAFYLRLKALQKNETDITNYILLIDEPGQGLHEMAQTDVKKVLEELSSNGMQILYTTHHPKLIDTEDKITRLRLVYQDQNDGTKIKTLSQMASLQGQQTLDTLSPIKTAMGLVNLYCIASNNNKNVIVEGITDKYYLEAFTKLLDIEHNYNIIPSCGCENIKNIASILLGWGYAFKVIIDKGEGTNPKEDTAQKIIKEKLLDNDDETEAKRIKRLSQTAIEDVFTKDDFRKHVKPEGVQHQNKNNVKLAKEYGKKELWARLFLEKVNNNEITKDDFDDETLSNFEEIINWIKEE